MNDNHIVLKSWNKLELVKRIQDLEKRGYSCVSRIVSDTKTCKVWRYQKANYHAYKRDFKGTVDHTLYMVKMAREESA
ncbi:hypothetical protein [Metabacillus bambusae]|uniref:Uncharacterized protein n=1 Tax=Metabacillus bambusae TaxID=2795218 RepID=A0ABS3NBL6_9BACI|nr:hypothetical protein [Metabacillus bambusae]MBO1515578.1 hypothetical protein [Metabacillus bambusae]